jgi:hypothetical protein
VKAFEEDVFEWNEEMGGGRGKHSGCDKVSVCGTVEQTKTEDWKCPDCDRFSERGRQLQGRYFNGGISTWTRTSSPEDFFSFKTSGLASTPQQQQQPQPPGIFRRK